MNVGEIRKGDTSVTINDAVVELRLPIQEALKIKGVLVLRLNEFRLPSDDPNVGRNIIALDREGNEMWRIQPFWHTVKAEDGRKVPDSYRSIRLEDDGKLYAFQGVGCVCEIDQKTGKIVGEEFTR